MNFFSISDLEQFSGIKSHTIRAWEQRYGALTPNRSEGNTRYYDNTQLRRLLNIVSLLSYDYKVSELCAKTDQQLFKLLSQNLRATEVTGDPNIPFISQLINAGINFDEATFDKIFSHCILKMGVKRTYTDILYPMLERIGLMWATAEITPAYEHFISNLVRQKLFTAIDSLPVPGSNAESWVLFLPENELHEIGLLFAHYMLKESGRKVIYLGSNIPVDTLKHATQEIKPSHLLCFLVHHQTPSAIKTYTNLLKTCFPKTSICIAGSDKILGPVILGKNSQKITSAEGLSKLLGKNIV